MNQEHLDMEVKSVQDVFMYNLRLLRTSYSFTTAELSDVLGLNEKRIGNLECGQTPPTLMDIVAIIAFFKIDFNDLLDVKIELTIKSKN